MKCTSSWAIRSRQGWLGQRLHMLGVLGLVLAALGGQPVESSWGWVTCPPAVMELGEERHPRRRVSRGGAWLNMRAGLGHLRQTWLGMVVRSEVLGVLWGLSGGWLPGWVVLLPGLEWLLGGLGVGWPWLDQQPEVKLVRWGLSQGRAGSVWLLSVEVAGEWLLAGLAEPTGAGQMSGEQGEWVPVRLVAGTMVPIKAGAGGQIEVEEKEELYEVHLGEWRLRVSKGEPFRLRQLILFLRQLEAPTERQGSRATRDGRRPLVRQQQLAEWFKVPQPHISRWEGYWLAGDWANLLSLKSPEILTEELRTEIVQVLARFPWWDQRQVYHHLRQQGVAVTERQVQQVAQQSGWRTLRQTLKGLFLLTKESVRPRQEGLVEELLGQVQMLLDKVEQAQGLTPAERLDIAHLQALGAELGLSPKPGPAPVPWAQKVKWLLFTAETTLTEGAIHCNYCGGTQVRPKGRKGRHKRYLDGDTGQWHSLEVYRYRCDNPECSYGSFTHLPLGLLPHSPYPLQTRLQALQLYAWGRSSYRRTAQALGFRAGRVYLWVTAFGQDLLPVAALFGLVRSSGVVGVDEKWVQVPDKAPRGSGRSKPQARRWVYVYLAVDVYTYDLLHIALYEHNTAASTRAFLLALRAKGYQPQVIVTDLRQEYEPAIAKIFPQARHHQCLFHALQGWHRQLKKIYGSDYPQTQPQIVTLREDLDAIFRAKTKRTAQKRYDAFLSRRNDYIAPEPEVAPLFDSLQRHWPKLVNGIESTIIPRTNNAVELVIRRFDQHYQTFCGFDSLDSARRFLAVFEKVYRFTPFTEDAQPRVRGKSPLELAGYDISQLPMTHLCRGWALAWPLDFHQQAVPNV
jgi:transposase-like protein